MKYVARLLSLFILVSAGIFYASCDGGDDPEKRLRKKRNLKN